MTGIGDRDRDASGRARNQRARDELGRPLPRGQVGVPTWPEELTLSADESLSAAQDLLDRGSPFQAHEVLEAAWKSAPATERALWKGLAQLAVGATHAARGNPRGAEALLRRGRAALLAVEGDAPHQIDAAGLAAWASESLRRIQDADGAVIIDAPQLRRG